MLGAAAAGGGAATAREEAEQKEGAVTEEAGPKSARPGAADCGTGEERGRDAQIAIWACSSGGSGGEGGYGGWRYPDGKARWGSII